MGFIVLIIYVLLIIGMWKIFEKAGQAGWKSIIPIYNLYILTVIAQKPGWWIIMFIIPVANIVFYIMLWHEIAKRFGKDVGYTIGLVFLNFIFVPVLGLSNAQYTPEETGNE